MGKQIRILLADDHCLLRAGLKMLLESRPGIIVAGEASDGVETLELLESVPADILILDLSLPNMDGLECINEIKSRGIRVKIIVLTMHDDENYMKAVMRAGAMAYVQKASVYSELFKAIDIVIKGKIYLGKNEAQVLLQSFLSETQVYPREDDPYKILSVREREVLKQLSQGYLIKEVADNLGVSSKTIDTYKARIMEKLNFKHKNELVSYALRHNLLS